MNININYQRLLGGIIIIMKKKERKKTKRIQNSDSEIK